MTEASRLAVLVDGSPLDPEAARALWTEFSQHMDEHRGDMAGFARKKGYESVVPEFQKGRAVLVVRTGAAVTEPRPLAKQKTPPAKQKAPPPKQKAPPTKNNRGGNGGRRPG
jgi:hypothetical protein